MKIQQLKILREEWITVKYQILSTDDREREINKLISSYRPQIEHNISFYYEFDLGNIFKGLCIKKIIDFIFKIVFLTFSKQKNLMCIHIDKINSKLRKD